MSTVTIRRRDVAWAAALLVLLASVWVVPGEGAGAQVPTPQGVDVVYVAVGTNFPDALGSGPAGGVNGAPIILVPTNPPLPAVTEAELTRLDPKTVVIVGGEAVISPAIATAIQNLLPGATIDRLAGADRYETNTLLTESVFPVEGWATVPPQAFAVSEREIGDLVVEDTFVWFDQGANPTEPGTRLYAPIQLPHGATILEFEVDGFNKDNIWYRSLTVGLRRLVGPADPALGGTLQLVAEIEALEEPFASFPLSTTSITYPSVDNSQYSYVVTADTTWWGLKAVGTVRVRYRVGVPGP